MRVKLYDRIEDVPREPWNRLAAGRSVTFSWEFWQIIERSEVNGVEPRHALFVGADDVPVALASYYSISTDIAIFAPRWLRRALASLRRWYPNLLKLQMLECGTPVTLNSPPIVATSPEAAVRAAGELDDLLRHTARNEGQWVIVVRDFEPGSEFLQPILSGRGYRWVDGLPNTYLDIEWSSPEEYLAAMRSYYRSKLLRHLRRCREQGVRHELVANFAAVAGLLARQWQVVHESADEFQREVLTEHFYREFASALPGCARALLLYRGDELVGHTLLLKDGELLRWLYFGKNAAVNESLYIYAAFQTIAAAIALGARRLEMGLTTYPVKQDLGALAAPIRFALRGTRWWIDIFVVPVYAMLNRTRVPPERPVFKRPVAS